LIARKLATTTAGGKAVGGSKGIGEIGPSQKGDAEEHLGVVQISEK